MLRKHRVCHLGSNSWRTWQLFPLPTSRKFPRKCLLTSWHAFLPVLTIVLMVPQTPNQTAQGSSFFMGHSCCCFKSHHSFISSAFRGSFCLQVVFLQSCAKPTVMFCCCAAGGKLSLVHRLQFQALNSQTSSPINYHLIPSYVHAQQWGSVHGQRWRRKWIENTHFLK